MGTSKNQKNRKTPVFSTCARNKFFLQWSMMKKTVTKKYIFMPVLSAFLVLFLILPVKVPAKASGLSPFSPLGTLTSSNGKKIIAVSKKPVPGSYQTISEAVEKASNGDIIVIYPGEYNESVDTRKKDIIIMGTSRDNCIIKYDTSRYSAPVLNISAGIFSNLTLIGYKSTVYQTAPVNSTDSITVSEDNVDELFSGYVIHIDDDYQYGRSVIFNNCNIFSENNNCIGLGFRNHCSVSFNNCYMKSTGIAGILFVHDPDTTQYGGTDMQLSFSNNTWVNYGSPYVMCAKSINGNNRVELTFRDVTTYCYATNKEGLYAPGNAYNGADLRILACDPGSYTTPIIVSDIIGFENGINALKKNIPFDEPGICFIADENPGVSDVPVIASIYFINNPHDLPGNNWAGSNSFVLTEDSSGNTLEEMNYIP